MDEVFLSNGCLLLRIVWARGDTDIKLLNSPVLLNAHSNDGEVMVQGKEPNPFINDLKMVASFYLETSETKKDDDNKIRIAL